MVDSVTNKKTKPSLQTVNMAGLVKFSEYL